MFRKEDVRFPAEGGTDLSAWLFVPEQHPAPLPAITMAPTAAAETRQMLPQYHRPIDQSRHVWLHPKLYRCNVIEVAE